LYVLADFVVVETGGDEKSPIILGQPFMNTAGAIIYANTAKIYLERNFLHQESSATVPYASTTHL
jgi:hypothetical protein